MLRLSLIITAVLSGCGAPKGSSTVSPRAASVADHESAAAAHDRRADELEARKHPETEATGTGHMECIDQPLTGVPDTGGKPINVLRPCWSSVLSPSEQDERDAEEHRRQAAEHRAAAAALIGAEREHCRGMGELEVSTSPFWHRRDIERVREVRGADGALRGATVRFRAVPGLSAEWLLRAAKCHQARAAILGHPTTFMTYCPLALPAVDIDVRQVSGGFDLTVTSRRSEIAAAILGRARDLERPAGETGQPFSAP